MKIRYYRVLTFGILFSFLLASIGVSSQGRSQEHAKDKKEKADKQHGKPGKDKDKDKDVEGDGEQKGHGKGKKEKEEESGNGKADKLKDKDWKEVKKAAREERKEKVTICHFPPGNPDKHVTITISQKAAEHHIQQHGDKLGACPDVPGLGTAVARENDKNQSATAPDLARTYEKVSATQDAAAIGEVIFQKAEEEIDKARERLEQIKKGGQATKERVEGIEKKIEEAENDVRELGSILIGAGRKIGLAESRLDRL